MADPYGLELSGLDPEYVAELRKLSKQQMMADELAKRGMTPLQGQMVGGVYVRPSVFQGLAGLANSWAAKNERDKVDEGYKSLGEKRKAIEQAAFDKFQQGFYGSPEKTEPPKYGDVGPLQSIPAVVPDINSKQQAIIELLRSQSPTAKMVAPMMSQELNRQREQQDFRDAIKGAMGGGQLTGFEPVQGGVPGQRGREMGFVGDVQKAIQEVATHPNMSIEEKQAAIAQIKEQSAGAGGGQIDPRAMLLSGNPKAMQVGQFLEGQQGRIDLAKQNAQAALEKQRQHDQVMGALGGGEAKYAPVSVVKRGPDGKDDPKLGTELISRSQAIQEKRTLGGSDPTIQGSLASAKSEGNVVGEGAGKAKLTLPGAQKAKDAAITHVKELLSHPGFESYVGMTLRPFASKVDGTPEADFKARLDQLEGGAFLEAYTMLKGGGAITEIEGIKATTAMNRMKKSTSEAEFQLAAKDYEDALTRGFEKLEAQSKMVSNPTNSQDRRASDKPGSVLRFDAQGNPVP